MVRMVVFKCFLKKFGWWFGVDDVNKVVVDK